ncbi:MAG TPA: glycosylase [Planctomycetaceae bacterium]|nr:glycosylase [Planctomycetaceae bacterium]
MPGGRQIVVKSLCLWIWWSCCVFASEPFPEALTRFVPVAKTPQFTGAGEGHWDARIRERGTILHDGDVWKIWYTGYDGTRPGLKMLGYATSPDGINWTRSPVNPLYREHWVEDVCVVKHRDTYFMFAEGFLDRPQLLTSQDGVQWTRQGPLEVRNVRGERLPRGPLGTPTVWVEDDTWYLFYERSDKAVWLATSKDQKTWTNLQDEPVLSPGPALYDRDLVAFNQILKIDGVYYAVYHGAATDRTPALWATGLARSSDLRHWEKFSGNPLRPIEENKSSGQLFPVGTGYRLYTVHDRVEAHESPR